MPQPVTLYYDLDPISCYQLAEGAFGDKVSVRLDSGIASDDERVFGGLSMKERAEALEYPGNILAVDGAEKVDDVRFTVEFGPNEIAVVCKYSDLVPIERVEEKDMATARLGRRHYLSAEAVVADPIGETISDGSAFLGPAKLVSLHADEIPERITRQFPEPWTPESIIAADLNVEDVGVEATGERVYYTEFVMQPTAGGEEILDRLRYMAKLSRADFVPLTRDEIRDRNEFAPHTGAPFITKVFLRDRKNPVLVVGDFDDVVGVLEPRETSSAIEDVSHLRGVEIEKWVRFQRVTQDGMVSANEIAINPDHVVSVESERS